MSDIKNYQDYINEFHADENNSSEHVQNDLPPVTILGDGVYTGTIFGYTFIYNSKKYKSKWGVRGINCPITITIKDNEQIDTII